jgi:gluconolactonase
MQGRKVFATLNTNSKYMYKAAFTCIWALTLFGCQQSKPYVTTGQLETIEDQFKNVVSPGATAEIIAEGYQWSEGPVWVTSENVLLFSDVPANTIYAWDETQGARVYLTPSGFTGVQASGNESGSNGLLINHEGKLVLCQHGNRAVAHMNSDVKNPSSDFIFLASSYQNKRFNSPNDITQDRQGNYFFTDPPYGLAGQDSDSTKEMAVNGVYKINPRGQIQLLIDSLTRPNGIALSPDQSKLYVANSDSQKARWYEYVLSDTGVVRGRILYDASHLTDTEKGLPDGLKTDQNGNVIATGPGGVWFFNASGVLLGKMRLPKATSNCALSPDDKILYVTNDDQILRIRLRD